MRPRWGQALLQRRQRRQRESKSMESGASQAMVTSNVDSTTKGSTPFVVAPPDENGMVVDSAPSPTHEQVDLMDEYDTKPPEAAPVVVGTPRSNVVSWEDEVEEDSEEGQPEQQSVSENEDNARETKYMDHDLPNAVMEERRNSQVDGNLTSGELCEI